MPERLVRQSAILCASLVLAACGQVIAPEGPAGDPGAIGFQDCEPPFVFDGDSTIAALGIDAEGLTHELTMPGHIRITRDTVTHEEFAPPDTPVFIEEGQVLCIEWAGGNGGGMAMMLAEPWAPPGVLDPSALDGPAPLALIALIAVLLVAGVISWLAFGRERSSAS